MPIEPEYGRVKDFDTETSRVDDLFKVSSIGQSVFVPRVEQEVRAASERKKSVSKTKTEANWNGFPTKSLYGEFPIAADKDPPVGGRADIACVAGACK